MLRFAFEIIEDGRIVRYERHQKSSFEFRRIQGNVFKNVSARVYVDALAIRYSHCHVTWMNTQDEYEQLWWKTMIYMTGVELGHSLQHKEVEI